MGHEATASKTHEETIAQRPIVRVAGYREDRNKILAGACCCGNWALCFNSIGRKFESGVS